MDSCARVVYGMNLPNGSVVKLTSAVSEEFNNPEEDPANGAPERWRIYVNAIPRYFSRNQLSSS